MRASECLTDSEISMVEYEVNKKIKHIHFQSEDHFKNILEGTILLKQID